MTFRDHNLRIIQDLLNAYPNASVRVKFDGSDNYSHFPSAPVTNEAFCEAPDNGFVFEDFGDAKSEAKTKQKRSSGFTEWFKINALEKSCEANAKQNDGAFRSEDHAKAELHTSPPLGGRMNAGDAPFADWADLGEKDFEKALQTITSIDELNGLANRRRVLRHDFKKWNEAQIGLILNRKFILENKNG
jgi:hypothetical protein